MMFRKSWQINPKIPAIVPPLHPPSGSPTTYRFKIKMANKPIAWLAE